MTEYYVQPEAAYKKLKEAQSDGKPVYIYGVAGYGKTLLVKNFFRYKKVDYRSCMDAEWKKIVFPGSRVRKRFLAYVFDDVQFLADEKRRSEICALLRSPQAWVILISRGCRPSWLLQSDFERNFLMITERDLRLNRSEMDRVLLSHHVKLENAEAEELLAFSQGNGYAISVAAQNFETGLPFRQTLQLMARVYYQYVYDVVMEQNTPEVRDFVSMVSVVKHFTLPLAEKITQRADAKEIISQIEERSNFLARDENGWYFRDPGVMVFHNYGLMRLGGGQMRACALRAAEYLRTHGQMAEAIKLYDSSFTPQEMLSMLLQNAELGAIDGYYTELRNNYLKLPQEVAKKNPLLMKALGTLHYLDGNVRGWAYWHSALRKYARSAEGKNLMQTETFLAYGDLVLRRGDVATTARRIERYGRLQRAAQTKTPKFLPLYCFPSVLDGLRDCCDWLSLDLNVGRREIARLRKALGDPGRGIEQEFLAERSLEFGDSNAKTLQKLVLADQEASRCQSAELALASLATRCRLYLQSGAQNSVGGLLASFEKKWLSTESAGGKSENARQDEERKILQRVRLNFDALRCRTALYANDMEAARHWMQKAPDEHGNFSSLERYRYVTKIRCYIAEENYVAAQDLIERLKCFARQYHRTYLGLELGILSSLVLRRAGGEWRGEFVSVLRQLARCGLAGLLADYGAAALDMFNECESAAPADENFMKRAKQRMFCMAGMYPLYLKGAAENKMQVSLSETALRILRLQEQGRTAAEIAEKLKMGLPNVKYHIKETYRKLDVNTKLQAVLEARKRGLL